MDLVLAREAVFSSNCFPGFCCSFYISLVEGLLYHFLCLFDGSLIQNAGFFLNLILGWGTIRRVFKLSFIRCFALC